jgi:glycosyltransferase involved in cell wall biosynthesis
MKFSVLLPTRNRKELLARAIETVRRQDYDNWEIIVSDNFSDEDISGYVASLSDPRIKYFRTDSFIPVTENWNNALIKSDGDYIIMLGDDDCIMKGYFSTLSDLIKQFKSPDFIYTNAFLYAYPSVMPSVPEGFLRTYSNRSLFYEVKVPYFLEKKKAMELVDYSLNFKVMFDYNMQFSLVSRKLINNMKVYGEFYQSPYPDYYASNAIMLKAETILVVPEPLVTIGISPKSFGFYYFNDEEADGNAFLKNIADPVIVNNLRDVILPGSEMNTSWLVSMETLVRNFASEFNIKVSYKRYRLIQICSVYAAFLSQGKNVKKVFNELKNKVNLYEKIRFGLFLHPIIKIIPIRFRNTFANKLAGLVNSHPAIFMPDIKGEFKTILDVFDQVNPQQVSLDFCNQKNNAKS